MAFPPLMDQDAQTECLDLGAAAQLLRLGCGIARSTGLSFVPCDDRAVHTAVGLDPPFRSWAWLKHPFRSWATSRAGLDLSVESISLPIVLRGSPVPKVGRPETRAISEAWSWPSVYFWPPDGRTLWPVNTLQVPNSDRRAGPLRPDAW